MQQTGKIGKSTILFMDKPETALHTYAIKQMLEMLDAKSKEGVEIFLASQSYFVIKELTK